MKFSRNFKRLVRDTTEHFLLLCLVLGFAVALSFFEDWLIATNRPRFMIWGASVLSFSAFLVDGAVFVASLLRVVYALFQSREH